MNTPRHKIILKKETTALLIVDIQERIVKVMRNHKSLVESVLKLIKGAKTLNLKVFYTEQYPKGLGSTLPIIKNELQDEAIQKLSFSCSGAENLFEELKRNNIKQVIVCGIESHVCVQQTVLDLLSNSFQVNVPADGVSSRKEIDYNTALSRMGKHGAEITTVESILFELLEVCGTPEFKEISKIIK
ncbi:MAG: hydrolase [Ignavibacteriae bacterium]|nr:MAG: hydrolase [Ignavibacteriota bacterium]